MASLGKIIGTCTDELQLLYTMTRLSVFLLLPSVRVFSISPRSTLGKIIQQVCMKYHRFYIYQDFEALARHASEETQNKHETKDVSSDYHSGDIMNKMMSGEPISAHKLSEEFFPTNEVHQVFISHRREDSRFAFLLNEAIKAHNPHIKCFVDSISWSHVNREMEELLKMTSHAASNYDLLLKMHSHLEVMLMNALRHKIEKASVFILLQSKEHGNITNSPWLNEELQLAKEVYDHEKALKKAKGVSLNFLRSFISSFLLHSSLSCMVNIEYSTNTTFLENLSYKELLHLF